jgi:DNA-binding transcriptional LysR family regulator
MTLNLHLVRLFAGVVTHNGFGAAGRALHVTQPAVSRAVRELETQLGLSLLVRSSRGITLTDGGRELYAQALAILDAERTAEAALDAVRGLDRGTLLVGASPTIASYMLPEIIGAFQRQYPGIDVQLTAVPTRGVVRRLFAYRLDIAMAEAPVSDSRLSVVPWQLDDMVAIAAPSHPLASRRRLTPAMLAGELLVLREPQSRTREVVLSGFRRAGVTPRRIMSVEGIEPIKQLVAGGTGVSVLSRHAIVDQLELGRLVVLPVRGLVVQRMLNRLALPARKPSPAARAFNLLLDASADPGPRKGARR